jgi:hypothetical protein
MNDFNISLKKTRQKRVVRWRQVVMPVFQLNGHGILIMKANEMHYFSYVFDKVLYMFRTRPLSIIRSTLTLYIRNRYLSFLLCFGGEA